MTNKEAIRIVRELYFNALSEGRLNDEECEAIHHVLDALRDPDEIVFPAPVDDIEIREIVYFPGFEPQNKDERRFDVVKWENHIPPRVAGNKKIARSCYSVGTIEWDEHEEWFDFKSIGTRWLELTPSKEVNDMILNFCEEMSCRYKEKDEIE